MLDYHKNKQNDLFVYVHQLFPFENWINLTFFKTLLMKILLLNQKYIRLSQQKRKKKA